MRRFSTPQSIFICVASLCGVLVALITPPFQAPDEQVHFYRAYQISEGSLLGEIHTGQAGAWLPASLPAAAEPFLRMRGRPARQLAELPIEALQQPLERDERRFVAFETTTLYSPVPYVPQALGIALGKLFDLGPLPLLYLSRLANLAVGVLLVLVALHVVPVFRWVLLLLALMPMNQFQLATASADAFTNSVAFLFVALILRAAHASQPLRSRELALLLAASLLLSLSKQAYAPLVVLLFAIPRERFVSHAFRVGTLAAILSINAVAVGLWAFLVVDAYVPPAWIQGIDPSAQLEAMFARPARFVGFLLSDLARSFGRYFHMMVGSLLGSVDVALPMGFIRAYQVVLVVAALFDSRREIRVSWCLKLAAAVVAIGDLVLVWTLIYVDGTPVGQEFAWGIQGRYFIPLSPLFLLPFYNRGMSRWLEGRVGRARWLWAARTAFVVGFLILSSAVVCYSLLERYYAAGTLS